MSRTVSLVSLVGGLATGIGLAVSLSWLRGIATSGPPHPFRGYNYCEYDHVTVGVKPLDDRRLRIDLDLALSAPVPDRVKLDFKGEAVESVSAEKSPLSDLPTVSRAEPTGFDIDFPKGEDFLRDARRRSVHLVVIDRPPRRFGWGHVTAVVPWINDFGIGARPGAWMETDVAIPPGLRPYETGGQGLRCGAPPIKSCREYGIYGPRRLVVALAPYDDRLARVGLAATIAASLAVIARSVRRAFAHLRERRGVEGPPAENDATYRTAAPAPRELAPKLARRFAIHVALGLFAAIASVVAVARGAEGVATMPMPWVTAIAVAIVTLISLLMISSRTARALRPAAIGLAIATFALFDESWPAMAVVPLALLGAIEAIRALRRN